MRPFLGGSPKARHLSGFVYLLEKVENTRKCLQSSRTNYRWEAENANNSFVDIILILKWSQGSLSSAQSIKFGLSKYTSSPRYYLTKYYLFRYFLLSKAHTEHFYFQGPHFLHLECGRNRLIPRLPDSFSSKSGFRKLNVIMEMPLMLRFRQLSRQVGGGVCLLPPQEQSLPGNHQWRATRHWATWFSGATLSSKTSTNHCHYFESTSIEHRIKVYRYSHPSGHTSSRKKKMTLYTNNRNLYNCTILIVYDSKYIIT